MDISRRVFVAGASTAAGISVTGVRAFAQGAAAAVRLRVLATSDLHGCVLPWDYYKERPDPTVGLAGIASLVRAARAEHPNVLLVDNGDLLQGNPLADHVVDEMLAGRLTRHPMIDIMSELGFDAATPGNHDFNYGLELLQRCIAGAGFPFVCANVHRVGGGSLISPHVILERRVVDEAMVSHVLRIGITGFVPPQIMRWDKTRLEGKVEASDIVETARRIVPELRANCDLVIALSHSGISAAAPINGAENVSLQLANVPGIDVIVTGHSHRVFPGLDYASTPGVDTKTGKLGATPAVMPGFWGSHLGVVDLTLARSERGWATAQSTASARPIYRRQGQEIETLAVADAAVVAAIEPAHDATRKWVAQPVGVIDKAVHSYCVWFGFDPATALVNQAQIWYARQQLSETPHAALPLLSAAAPFRAGYTPDAFVDIAPGRVRLGDVADLYMYSNNTVAAIRITGAVLQDWLEFSARAFNTIVPGADAVQPLVDRSFPSFNFDVIAGITYTIAVDRPPKYTARGQLTGAPGRIGDLRYDGKPVSPDAEFVVVTNSHRADGGGGFAPLANAQVVLRAPDSNRDAVLGYFKSRSVVEVDQRSPWRFAPLAKPARVSFNTGLSAWRHLGEMPGLEQSGDGLEGYARVVFSIS